MADHLDLMTAMLHHHHTGEDRLLWPTLSEQGARRARPTVKLMEEQHDRIAVANDRVSAELARWRAGASERDREQLALALEEVNAALAEHLEAEEERILPLAAQNMTAAEWERLGEAGMAGIKKSQPPLAFGMLQYEGDPEVITMMLSHAPPLARVLMPFHGPRAFARYAKRLYGTATP